MKVIALCQAGATLALNGLHRERTSVRILSNAARAAFGEMTQVNAYCSWPGKQGFSLHFDTHEVIVLQVEGRKRWRVLRPNIDAPVKYHPGLPAPDAAPYLEQTISAGDVLYVPRGHWHDAIAEDGPSMHLTLGVVCRTGLSFGKWLADRLTDVPAWRADLPRAFGVGGGWQGDSSPLAAHLRALCADLTERLRDPETVRHFAEDCARHDAAPAPYQFPEQIVEPSAIEPETVLTRPATQQTVLSREPANGGHLRISVWGRQLTFNDAAAPLAEAVFARHVFSGAELLNACPRATWTEVRPLLTGLLRAGLIFVDRATP
jgi:ribosomal protein L16 Arg81 hydroxylase